MHIHNLSTPCFTWDSSGEPWPSQPRACRSFREGSTMKLKSSTTRCSNTQQTPSLKQRVFAIATLCCLSSPVSDVEVSMLQEVFAEHSTWHRSTSLLSWPETSCICRESASVTESQLSAHKKRRDRLGRSYPPALLRLRFGLCASLDSFAATSLLHNEGFRC